MCHPRNRPVRPAGFTLLELLVSLAILALVMTLVYGAFGQLSSGASNVQQRLGERQELRLLLRMVGDDLRAAQWAEHAAQQDLPTGLVALTEREEPGEIGAALRDASGGGIPRGIGGEEDLLEPDVFSRAALHVAGPARFHRQLPEARDPLLHEVGYRVVPAADLETPAEADPGPPREGLVLVRREEFYLSARLDEGGVSVPLADRIAAFRVEMLPPGNSGGSETAEDNAWQAEWNAPTQPDDQRMPAALRLTLGRYTASGRLLVETVELNLLQVDP